MKGVFAAALIAALPAAALAQDVAVRSLTCTLTRLGPKIDGQMQNMSSQPLSYLEARATFRDAQGKFVSLADGLAALYNPLPPGRSSPFTGFGYLNPTIASVTIEPAIMGGAAFQFSGMSGAPCVARADAN
jgi:hypothetical protein